MRSASRPYGWHVQRVEDVNDLEALGPPRRGERRGPTRPSLIIVRSHIAYPAPHAHDTAKAHGAPLGEEEVRATKEVLGFDPDATFYVPDGVYEHMSSARGAARTSRPNGASGFDAWREAFPSWQRTGTSAARRELRPGWDEALPTFDPGRSRSSPPARPGEGHGGVQAVRADHGGRRGRPRRVDEDASTAPAFRATFAGRNIPFGIREHAMGAIVNGLALHGGIVKPFGSTFLIFSDYMRPPSGCRR